MRRSGGDFARVLATVCLAGTACYSYSKTSMPRAEAPAHGLGPKLRVTTRDGRVITLLAAQMRSDSLIGLIESDSARISIPINNVASLARLKIDRAKTIGFSVVLVLLAAATFVAIAAASLGPNY